jgi:NADPH2:quinone reductase
MRALAFERFGGPEVLAWREVPEPVAGPGQAVVQMARVGLNLADVYRRRGTYHLAGEPPWILGYEGVGRVLRAPPTSGLAAGQRVGFADSPFANAERVAVDADRLIPLAEPDSGAADAIDDDTAAAVLLQGLTAQYLVRDSHAVRPGDWAVVHAAGGGVGLLLVQLLVAAGARVIGIASSAAKRDAAREAGAAVVLGAEGWAAEARAATAGRGADVVYDSVGATLAESLAVARPGGAVVFYGMAGGDPAPVDPRLLMDRSLALIGGDLWNVLTTAAVRRARAAELFRAVASGALRVRIAARFPLAEGAAAHRFLESRAAIGKVLLTL